MFSFFLPDWRYNHAGKHRSSILYLCWSWLVNGFVFNVQPASMCTARTSWPHVILFNLNSKRTTGCAILFQISKWHLKQTQRLHFSSCAVEGRVRGFAAELHQQLGLNIVQMFTSRRVWKCPLTSAVVPMADQNLCITLWNISTCTWWAVCSYFMVNGMSHACSCVAARLKYKMSGEKWIVVFPSLCQHRHQSFQKSWTVTFPWPQPLYLQITMVC